MKLEGKNINLRLVEIEDVQFIFDLRSDKNLNKYFTKIDDDINRQIDWLKGYKTREENKEECYFVIQGKNNQPYGVARLSQIRGDSFCIGSWIIRRGSPFYAAIETILMCYEFGFNTLGLKKAYFHLLKENKKLIKHHQSFGAKVMSEDDENYYYEFKKKEFEEMKRKYARYFQYAVREDAEKDEKEVDKVDRKLFYKRNATRDSNK